MGYGGGGGGGGVWSCILSCKSFYLFLGVERGYWAFYSWFEVISGREALIHFPSKVDSAFVLSV